MMNTKTYLAATAIGMILGLAHPAAANNNGGLVANLTGTAASTLNTTLSHTGGALATNNVANLSGTVNKSTAALGVTGTGAASASRGGILSQATGVVDSHGRVGALDVFGDDLVKVKLDDGKTSAASRTDNGLAVGGHNVGLTEGQANALVARAVNMDGIPRAHSVRVNENGSITLGASYDDGDVKARAKTRNTADADLRRTLESLPVSYERTEDGTRVAARTPRGDTAEVRASRAN